MGNGQKSGRALVFRPKDIDGHNNSSKIVTYNKNARRNKNVRRTDGHVGRFRYKKW